MHGLFGYRRQRREGTAAPARRSGRANAEQRDSETSFGKRYPRTAFPCFLIESAGSRESNLLVFLPNRIKVSGSRTRQSGHPTENAAPPLRTAREEPSCSGYRFSENKRGRGLSRTLGFAGDPKPDRLGSLRSILARAKHFPCSACRTNDRQLLLARIGRLGGTGLGNLGGTRSGAIGLVRSARRHGQ